MLLVAETSRPAFYTLPTWLKVVFYLSAAAALVVFGIGAWRHLRRYRAGRRDEEARPSLGRFLRAAVNIGANRTVGRGHLLAGISHWMVFWGFAGLFVATILVLIDQDILHLIFDWTFLRGNVYLVFSWLADLSGVLLLAGVILLVVRRYILRPRELQIARPDDAPDFPDVPTLRRDDWIFLGLLFVAGISGFLVEGLRIQATDPSFEAWSFTGWMLAGWLGDAGTSAAGAESAFGYLWVVHAITAIGFIAYFPFSKAWHMVAGWYTLAAKPDHVGRMPAAVESASGGYGYVSDLSGGELAGLDACIRCGRCHVACPATESGLPLSPRDLILAMRASARRLLPAPAAGPGTAPAAPALAPDLVPESWVWSCTTCAVCDEVCPLGVQHLPLILQMRRHLVAEGAVEPGIQDTLTNVMRYGNSFGTSPRRRARWTRDLDFEIPDARERPVEYLWFVGDYASFDPRVQEITKSVARVFHQAGIDFGILYEAEQNAGADVRRIGEEGLFEMQVERNLEALGAADFRHLVTTDPHSYFTLRIEYAGTAGNGGPGGPVLHYTELLDRLIAEGRLRFDGLGTKVTYHDPCYLGRYSGVFDPPRRILEAVGAALVEMPRNREEAFCCGAGGGRIWMEDAPGGGERPAESRVREAAALGGVGTLVVGCPKDLVMFQDAVKTTGLEDSLMVKDVIELIEEASRTMDRSAQP